MPKALCNAIKPRLVQATKSSSCGTPAIGTGFAPDSDYIIRRHKVQLSPDRTSYETIDTTEVRRRISLIKPAM